MRCETLDALGSVSCRLVSCQTIATRAVVSSFTVSVHNRDNGLLPVTFRLTTGPLDLAWSPGHCHDSWPWRWSASR